MRHTHTGVRIHGCHVIDDGHGFRTAICCKPYAVAGTRASGARRNGVTADLRAAAADLRLPPPPPHSTRCRAVFTLTRGGWTARRETDNNAQYRPPPPPRREKKTSPVRPSPRPNRLSFTTATVFRSPIRLVTASRRTRFSPAPPIPRIFDFPRKRAVVCFFPHTSRRTVRVSPGTRAEHKIGAAIQSISFADPIRLVSDC